MKTRSSRRAALTIVRCTERALDILQASRNRLQIGRRGASGAQRHLLPIFSVGSLMRYALPRIASIAFERR
jgi:hypothetical protein